MTNIAIIPARGGSKRIPQKNIINFNGKPLIAWTIEAAKVSGVFSRIVVSTDDVEIAETAASLGVDVPFLREDAFDDIAPVSLATIAAVNQSQKHWNESFEITTQLMPNCPLRGADDICKSFDHFLQTTANFQMSCFRYGWMNPWWAAKLDNQSKPEFIFPDALKKRSQDLPELFCPSGAIWIARTNDLFRAKTFYGEGHTFFPINWKSAVDIDDYEDLEFASAVFYQKNGCML